MKYTKEDLKKADVDWDKADTDLKKANADRQKAYIKVKEIKKQLED